MAAVPSAAPPASAGEITVVNPATGVAIARVPQASAADVAATVAAARAAQRRWRELGFDGRGSVLRRMSQWVLDNADRLVATIVGESGKPSDEAVLSEIGHPANCFRYWADQAPRLLADEVVESSSPFMAGKTLMLRREPLGVVGVIGPWNFPFTNCVCDCIPALAAGNAVVLKPSELTPLTSLLVAEGMRECGMPAGVFSVVTGDGATGEALIDEVDFLMFTGSAATGRRVMERAARTLTPVALELGGNDALIVLEDADLERAANGAVWFSMQNAGQVCISVERAYVVDAVFDEFVAAVVDKVGALRQGPPGEHGSVDVGPMASPGQADIVKAHVDDAVANGATVLVGGELRERDGGRYCTPTVLVDVDHGMRVMREETFGPVLPIMRVKDADEAIERANDSSYGLSASVFTRDTARGEAITRRLQAGAVCVNDAQVNFLALELPMAGWKSSGIGSRHGVDGIRKFTRSQAVVVTEDAPSREAYMFPYDGDTTSQIAALLRTVYGQEG